MAEIYPPEKKQDRCQSEFLFGIDTAVHGTDNTNGESERCVLKIPSKFVFTGHATRRGGERAISEEQFKTVVLAPDSRKRQSEHRAPHGGFNYIFRKKIEDRELHVVAEIHKDVCYFVTGYWQ